MAALYGWFLNNKLLINWSKTKAMVINRNATSLPPNLKILGNDIEFVNSFKLLGVLIDSQLNFSDHINSICRKVNAKCHILNRQSNLFTLKFKTTLFKLFIMSNFDYCSSVYCLTFKNEIDKLEGCFNRSVRRLLKIPVSRTDFNKSIELLSSLKLLPLRLRLFQRFSKFVFRVFDRANIASLLQRVKKCAREVRFPYIQPEFSSRFGEHSFANMSVKLLNKFVGAYLHSTSASSKIRLEKRFFNFLNDNLILNYKHFDNFF